MSESGHVSGADTHICVPQYKIINIQTNINN